MKIWDSYHKRWLIVLTLYLDKTGVPKRVEAREEIEDYNPLRDGWWTFEGKDLQHIGFDTKLSFNKELLP